MKRFALVLTMFLVASTVSPVGADTWISVGTGREDAAPTVEVERSTDAVRIDLELVGLWAGEVTIEGQRFTSVSIPELGLKGEEGLPYLPFRTVLVAIPSGPEIGAMTASAADPVTVLSGVVVQPAQRPRTDCGVAPNGGLCHDETAYADDRWYPHDPARIAEEIVVRGQRYAVVEISPVRYNPARGEVVAYRAVEVQLPLQGPVDEAAEALKARRFKSSFPVDIDSPTVVEELPTGIEYLILADDSFLTAVEPLAQWKRLKGLTVEVVPKSAVGTTSAAVKSYLQARYNADPDLTFVLLVGDHQQIPSESQSGFVSDLYYSCLDGSDYFPDVLLGRLSVQSPTDCSNVVSKIVGYERTPDPGAWHGDFLLAALLQDYDDYNCTADRWFFETGTHVMHYMRDVVGMGIYTAATSDSLSCSPYRWRNDGYPHRFSGYSGATVPAPDVALITNASTSTSDVAAAINAGVSIVQHRDHGGETGWGDPPFHISDVNNLTNADRLPVVFSINCLTGTFNYGSDCFAEAFMKKFPGGAVGVVGATEVSYSGYNDLFAHGIYDSMFDDYDPANGGNVYPHSFRPVTEMNYGKYHMYHWEGASSYTQYQFEIFHWFGDPEMEIVTAAPAPLTVSTSCPVAVGATSLEVTSSADGALVAVTADGVLLGRATVSGGVASVTLDPPPADPGELDVVVTGRNLEPWEGTCQVIVPSGPWLAYRDHVVDDSAGNGDGIVNPGEAVMIAVTVENIGTEDGGSLVGVLTTPSGDATVTDGTAAFPDLATNTSGQTLPDHFAFSVNGGVANGTVIPFNLDWTAEGGWSGSTGFGVSVCEPLLISNIAVAEVSDTEAVISWTTNLPATSAVRYGTTSPETLVEDLTPSTTHTVQLTGLDECTSYVFEVSSTSPGCYEVAGEGIASAPHRFTTLQGVEVLYDEVESGVGSWTVETPSGTGPWTITASGAHSPTHAWFSTDPGSIKDDRLTGGPFTLGSGSSTISFWHHYNMESGYDGGVVELSTDGVSWQDATTFGAFLQNGYNDTLSTGYSNPIGGRSAWSGDSSTYVETVLELSGMPGNQIWLRFRLGADSGVSDQGWWIDDIRIDGTAPCAAPEVFADGFESGDTTAWSDGMP